jgi:hypothetical protein
MRYNCLFAFCLCICLTAGAQSTICDTIAWSPATKLTWQNFKAPPDKSSSFKALTQSGMHMETRSTDKQVIIQTGTNFFSCASWTKVNSDSVLHHEQLHFDITELYRRMILKKILQGNYTKKDNNQRINAIYTELNNQWRIEEQKYDNETNHGIDQKRQLEWEKRIQEQLQSLEQFDKAEVTVVLK